VGFLGRRAAGRRNAPAIPKGRRVYAIGDIHGCTDLLSDLLHKIEQDNAGRSPARTQLVFLGDLIDRGPDSARLLRAMHGHVSAKNCHVIRGNHEATLSDALAGDHDAMDLWLQHGGTATLHSFGVPDSLIDPDDSGRMIAIAREAIALPIRQWLARLPLSVRMGDYFFVHAGIRPGTPLRRQCPADLLWIRQPFLASDADHGAVIVHGHSIHEDGVEFCKNRIGVDTGAYRTGRLSALALEGVRRWVINT